MSGKEQGTAISTSYGTLGLAICGDESCMLMVHLAAEPASRSGCTSTCQFGQKVKEKYTLPDNVSTDTALIWRNRNAIAAAESCRALSSDKCPRPTFFCRPKKMQARTKAPQKLQSHTSAGKLKADAMARQQAASTRHFMEAQCAIRYVGGGR